MRTRSSGLCPNQQTIRRRRLNWKLASLLLVVAGYLLPQSAASAPVKEVRRVLILNVMGPLSSPGVALMDEAIVAALQESPYLIELYSEDLEATLFPDEASQRQFREWYIRKYHDRKPDVIIAVGFEPIRFMVESHESFFPNTPIIFCGSTEEMLGGLKLDSHFTGVWTVPQPEETLKAALALQPGTRHVVVVGGVGSYDRYLEAIARESFRKYESKLDFTYLTNLAMPALVERLKHLPDHTIVYHTSIMQDAEGTHFIDASQSVPIIAGAARAPMFIVDDVDLGNGTVGGDLVSFAAIGKSVAQIAVRVLNGEKPQDIPVAKGANTYMFDWRALHRWGLKESDLPPGSVVRNRQPAVWELYWRYIVGSIVLLLFQTLLIFGLVRQRERRRKTETELNLSNDRLRQAMEAGKTLGWDWDVKTGRDRWFGDLRTIFGMQSNSYSGRVEDFHRLVHPEDRALVGKAVADARQSRKPYAAEFRVVRPDGTVRWITARGEFNYDANGDAERMLGMSVDITERKLAEEALKKSEEKFSKAFRKSPMLLTVTALKDHRYLDVNEAFEQISGWRREEVIGRTPFDLNLWVDPDQRVRMAKEIQAKGTLRNVEVAFRSKSGEVRLGLGSAELIEIAGEPCLLTMVTDITERKRIQEQLQISEARLAGIVGSAMDAVIATDAERNIVLFNTTAEKVFGCPADEAIGTAIDRFVPERFRLAHKEQMRLFGMGEFANRGVDKRGILFGLRAGGEEFPMEASISHLEANGQQLFTVVVRDVTERKKAEQLLRESEERFRLVANTAPVLIWMAGADKLCTYFNQPWLEFTGRPLKADLGNGWTEVVHPDDRSTLLDTYIQVFDRRGRFEMEYRLRRHDGEYRWVSDVGVPRFNTDGSFAGYIGSCMDVTERKIAEEALSNMAGKLIEAHEEERRWIGRELHDDINQRIALLSIELDRWNQSAGSSADTHDHIRRISQRLVEIGEDIQALSHRLHSSKLEYLGIVVAAQSFCRELSEQYKVQISFSHSEIPRNLPKEIALCLFRVLQESLQNAVKHSGAQEFTVEFRGRRGELQLSVIDAGRGFNLEDVANPTGLGLISMQQRLQLVNGELSIVSEVGRGTAIYARVPLGREEGHRQKAG